MEGISSNARKPLAWITGASGLIGNYLVQTSSKFAPGVEVFAPDHQQLDLTDFAGLRRLFKERKPSFILHCAAMSKTPACEANPAAATKINTEATGMLAELAAEIPFVFCSTDLVFDGKKGAYVEGDAPNPLSAYAETKVAAEELVSKNPRHAIVRLSLNYGHSLSGNRSFNEEMMANLKAGKTCKLFVDEFRSPTPAIVTAQALWDLVQKRAGGLFHLAAVERLSRFEMGELLIRKNPEYRDLLQKASLKEYRGAPRSPDTSLDCSKVQKLLSFPLPRFSEWVLENE